MSIFDNTDCNAIWYDAAFHSVVQSWLAERDMRATVASPADEWFLDERSPDFPYCKSFEESRWDPFAVLHTSGSTGLPKPIVVRQGMLAISDAFHGLPERHGTNFAFQAWRDMTELMFNPSTEPLPVPFAPLAGYADHPMHASGLSHM